MDRNKLEDFVFENHILRVEDQSNKIERLEKLISKKRSFSIRLILKLKLLKLRNFQKNSYDKYEYLQSFFQATSSNTKNSLKYNPRFHEVIISGSGIEKFKCNGKPTFKRIDSKEYSYIPVSIGSDEAELILYHPLSIDFSPFDDFEVTYGFETRFSLGGNWNSKFTKKQRKIYTKDHHKLFCGEPGKVYFRQHDALYEGFTKAIWRSCISKKILLIYLESSISKVQMNFYIREILRLIEPHSPSLLREKKEEKDKKE